MINMARSLGVAVLPGGLLIALLLTATACGGGDGTAAAPTNSTSKSGSADPQGAFRQCLQQHGITLPSRGPGGRQPGVRPSGRPSGRPTGRPSGFPSMSDQQRQALRACASLAPRGRFGGLDQSAFKAFQSCMKQHGVTVSNGFRGGRPTADPKFAKAFRTCRPLLPQRSGSPSPAPAPSS